VPVTVADNATATADFELFRVPTKLTEIVVTPTGDQRRLELGHVTSRIDVDSIAPTAPVTSLTDLLTARAPGVEITEVGGLTGAGQTIRIRGLSSMALSGEPIVIVDGIRQDNTGGGRYSRVFGRAVPGPSRINDLDVSQIATIDVLKGAAASAEYGTDAANGVILVTTKRGRTGAPEWHASAEQTTTRMPADFPEYYFSWGRRTDDGRSVNCPFHSPLGGPSQLAGTCTVDSVTHFSPFNHRAYTIYGNGSRRKYELSVSGGADAVRFYVSGGLSNETGMIRLPDVFRPEAAALHVPAGLLRPNEQDQRSLRANVEIRLSPTATATVTGAYMQSQSVSPRA
jgi:TonB-dependent SusC/RagA subfamily outer membrane receptor